LMLTLVVLVFALVLTYFYYNYVGEYKQIKDVLQLGGATKLDPRVFLGLKVLQLSVLNLQYWCYSHYYIYRQCPNISSPVCSTYPKYCLFVPTARGTLPTTGFYGALASYFRRFYAETGCRIAYFSVQALGTSDPFYAVHYIISVQCYNGEQFLLDFVGVIDNETGEVYALPGSFKV